MGIGPKEPKMPTFCARHFFEHLWIACTKTFTAELTYVWTNCAIAAEGVGSLLKVYFYECFLWSHPIHLSLLTYQLTSITISFITSCASKEPVFPCCSLFFLVVGLISNWSAPQVMGLIQFGIARVDSTNIPIRFKVIWISMCKRG